MGNQRARHVCEVDDGEVSLCVKILAQLSLYMPGNMILLMGTSDYT